MLLAKEPEVVWEKEGEGGRGGWEWEEGEGIEEEVVERRESRRGRAERRS